MLFQFPKDFLWGAATSAHQTEGNTNNNWTKWEKENAERLAREAHTKTPLQPSPLWKIIQAQATTPENYISGINSDHYHRFDDDFALAESLGHNAHRFSLEWSRIEPQEGVWDEEEIKHYRDVIRSLKKHNLEPFLTLWHWTLPLWLSEQGGVTSPKFSFYFSRYAEKVAEAYGDEIKFWITINEPEIFSLMSYFLGVWPPEKRGFLNYLRSLHVLIKSHRAAYRAIKQRAPYAQIGIAKNNSYFEVYQNKFVNIILKRCADWFWNRYFLNRICDYQDFIGLNYYFHNRIDYGFYKNEDKHISDVGLWEHVWELYPEGLYHVLKELKDYHMPIYITENGLADMEDVQREWYIKKSLQSAARAIQDGVDVRGYLYWSLLDNFEWDKGFWPRFGLIAVDYKTKQRTIRKNALAFKEICTTNKIEL